MASLVLLGQATIGHRLRAARVSAGISARKLGRLAGLSEALVSAIESNRRPNPAADTLTSLADVLGVPAGWLLAGEGSEPEPNDIRAAVAAASRRAS